MPIHAAPRPRSEKRSTATISTRHSPSRQPRVMSDAHKKALAEGRTHSYAIKAYLEALKNNKPKRGRKRTPVTIGARLSSITTELQTADPLQEVLLLQEQSDLQKELISLESGDALEPLEAGFIRVAKRYSASKGISRATWRKVGVPAHVLDKAGISV